MRWVSLLRSTADIAAFDAVFALVFRGMVDFAESRGDPTHLDDLRLPTRHNDRLVNQELGPAAPATGRLEAIESTTGEELGRPIPTLASWDERLTKIDFAQLTAGELSALAPFPGCSASIHHSGCPGGGAGIVVVTDSTSALRCDTVRVRAVTQPYRSGVPEPGRPAASSRFYISGSMEPYARAYLHLLWGMATRARAEVFVFGTRLTRLTRALQITSPDLALERAAALMPDWSGGTRIGWALGEFMNRHGRRGMARGAVVLIVSDGWERDDPSVSPGRWFSCAGMRTGSCGQIRG